MSNLLTVLFGCTHRNYTFPRTAKAGQRPQAAELTGTYVVCLDCGKEFPYDWQRMRVITNPQVVRSSGEKETVTTAA